MTSAADRPPLEPTITIIDEPDGSMSFGAWLDLVAQSEPAMVSASEVVRGLREHREH